MRLRFLALVAAAIGFAALAWGFWIPAKAAIGRVLMDRALNAGIQEQDIQKPWRWADFFVIGALEIQEKQIFVLDRATGQALAFGAGLHEEYGYPADPLVISGHRDTHFDILENTQIGDIIRLNELGTLRSYMVTETRIFDVREGALQTPPPGNLLLITCWPFRGLNPQTNKRFLVLAKETQVSGDITRR